MNNLLLVNKTEKINKNFDKMELKSRYLDIFDESTEIKSELYEEVNKIGCRLIKIQLNKWEEEKIYTIRFELPKVSSNCGIKNINGNKFVMTNISDLIKNAIDLLYRKAVNKINLKIKLKEFCLSLPKCKSLKISDSCDIRIPIREKGKFKKVEIESIYGLPIEFIPVVSITFYPRDRGCEFSQVSILIHSMIITNINDNDSDCLQYLSLKKLESESESNFDELNSQITKFETRFKENIPITEPIKTFEPFKTVKDEFPKTIKIKI